MPRLRRAGFIGLLFGSLALPALLTAQAGAGKGVRYAFLVGCSRYDKSEFRELPFTGNDVERFRQALLATGFGGDDVVVLRDGTDNPGRYLPEKAKILRELDLLLDGLRPQDTLVVALSGHGLQFKGDPVSYFVPVDGRVADKKSLLPLSGPGGLYEKLKACKAKRKLLIVNACRNDPTVSLDFAANKVQLADEDRDGEVPEGIAAIYSCSAGQKSYYDPDRKIALFFEHVIKAWQGEYSGGMPVTVDAFLEQVRARTKADANRTLGRSQVPTVVREYRGEWIITAAAELPKRPADTGIIAEMKFKHIAKGTFWMGWDSEKKQSKQVPIERDFELAAYCVTQAQWEKVMGNNPSYFSRHGQGKDSVKEITEADLARFPVENVSWQDVQAFIKKVNAQEAGKGWTYRLPKEVEWEYACRNAATSKEECSFDFYFEIGSNDLSSTQANFNGEYPARNGAKGPHLGRPAKVGSYAANKLGLYDMHGNVSQWCEDLYDNTGADRVIRGGSWDLGGGRICRAADRAGFAPSIRVSVLGFRLARVRAGG